MKTKTSMLIALAAVMMFAMTGCVSKFGSTSASPIDETTPDTAFEEVKVEQIGSHIYLEENYIERKKLEDRKEEIIAALEEADNKIDTDVFIYGISESYDKSGYSFVADMYVKGVDITDAKVRCDCENGVYTWKSSSGGKYVKQDIDIDTSNVIPAEELYSKVFDLAVQHKKDMTIPTMQEQPIRGEYTLWYNEEGGLYYFFSINENSSVEISATTGEIIKYCFSNGMVYGT